MVIAGKRRFSCPACGFTIFNRRIASCESCAAPLPETLLFTAQQLAVIDAEHAKNEAIREALSKAKHKRRGVAGGEIDLDFGDIGDGGGDGGGD